MARPPRWWVRELASTVDPISLDPIAELEYPPFELSATGQGDVSGGGRSLSGDTNGLECVDWLGLTATGARPGAPAAAALAG